MTLRPLNIDPQPAWVGWALMPARLVVAAFLHLEQTMKPDIDPDSFGHMFRSHRHASQIDDERAICQAVERFDAKHMGRTT